MKNIFVLLLLLPMLLFAQDEVEGEKLFKNKCKACHNIDKRLVGPALQDVHTRRDSTWLYAFIKNSQSLVTAGDSTAVALFAEYNQVLMPVQSLSDTEIGQILSYIKQESKPKVAGNNPIVRPTEDAINYRPLSFDHYFFWIPYTFTVIIIAALLYIMTFLYDLKKENMT